MVNTFIHYLFLSCARVMHFPSAFHIGIVGLISVGYVLLLGTGVSIVC